MTEKNTSLNIVELEVLLRGLNDQKVSGDEKYVAFYDENNELKSVKFRDELKAYLEGKKTNSHLLGKVMSKEMLDLCQSAVSAAYANSTQNEYVQDLNDENYSKLFNDVYCSVCNDTQKQHCKDVVESLNKMGIKNNLTGSIVVAEEFSRREEMATRKNTLDDARILNRK